MIHELFSRTRPVRTFATRARRARARAAGEGGFTLVEILVVVSLLSVVLGLLMAPLVDSERIENRDINYAFAQQNARTGLDSMVAQIRQATAIVSSGDYQVEMNVNLQGQSYTVGYECDLPQPGSTTYTECVRVQTTWGGTLPSYSHGTVVVSNLLNSAKSTPVFSWGPDPNAPYYMTATVEVPSSGGQYGGLTHGIEFTDGALMRNLNVGN